MAQTAVDVVVRVKDLAALERLKKSLAGVDGATLKAEKGINRFENSIKRLQGVLGGLAVGDQLRRAFGAAADFSATEARLENLTKQYSQFAGIQELAAASAQKFGVSQAQAASDFADLGSRLGASGANLKDLSDIYEGFNTLLAVNQVEAQQAASAQLQLNQALGSGVLQGDEFRSISEATPQLLDELAKTLGVTRGEIKKLGSEGKITAQVLVEALGNIAKDGGSALEDFFKTPAGQLKLFDKAIKDFQVTVGQQLLPVFTPVIGALSTLLQLFGQLPGPIKATAVAVAALGASVAILGGPITLIAAGIIGLTLVIKKFADENEAFAKGLQGAWDGFVKFLGGAIAGTQAAVQSLSKSFGEGVAYWKERVSAFLGFWAGIGQALIGVWNDAIQTLQGAWQAFVDFVTGIMKFIGDTWNTLTSYLGDNWNQAVSLLGQTWTSFVNFLGQTWAAISGGFNKLLQTMNINWADTIKNMINNASPLLMLFKAAGLDIGDAIVNSVKSGMAALKSFEMPEMPSFQLPDQSGFKPPSPTGDGPGGSKKGGGGSGSSEIQKQLELQNKLKQGADELLIKAQERLRVIEGITDFERIQAESAASINDVKRNYAGLLEEAKEITDAVARTEVEQTLKAAQALEIRNEELETRKEILELQKSATEGINEEIARLEAVVQGREKEYQRLKDIKELEEAMRNAGLDPSKAAGLVDRLNALREEAEAVQELKSQYESLASSIAGEITGAFRSVIDGTKTVEEAFADMLKGIADAFLDMAMKILQDAITKQLMSLFSSLLGGGPGPSIGGGGGFGGGIGLAEGGYITKPTQAMIGEAGEPEYAIPASKMASAMSRYNAGMRGDAVIAGASEHGDAEQGAYGSGSGNAPINVNYSGPIMRMDNTDYVKTSEIPGIVNQSAKAGEARALGRLRTSVGTRRKLGMS